MLYKIIFMGTPDLAAECLKALASVSRPFSPKSSWEIIAVLSQPDKPKGRKLRLQPTPAKNIALQFGIPCFQPEKLRTPETLELLQKLAPDLIIVAAYGKILPQPLLDLPRYGCLNIHTSLLPLYRGAAPIQWAIIDGKSTTGVTLMKMNAGLDTGDILAVSSTPIEDKDNAQTLHDRLAQIGGELLIKTLPDYLSGNIIPTPQSEAKATYARKITKEDGRIHWTMSARQLDFLIRGLTPWPGTYCLLTEGDKKILLKILKAEPLSLTENQNDNYLKNSSNTPSAPPPGTILRAENDELWIACGEGILRILELQREGKKPLPTRQFISGTSLTIGTQLE